MPLINETTRYEFNNRVFDEKINAQIYALAYYLGLEYSKQGTLDALKDNLTTSQTEVVEILDQLEI